MEKVVLVDEKDNQIGVMEKQAAHVAGRLHRAVSVFVFNSCSELLLQRRAAHKYHSPSLWTNTCCGHPRPAEAADDAANRRLFEEMGMTCVINKAFSFVYKADVGGGLTEYEYDHVYTGVCDTLPIAEPEEVAEWKYMSLMEIREGIARAPEEYTEWFKMCIADRVMELFKATTA
jgi:isopentenyl-diphosphate delta-isomerase